MYRITEFMRDISERDGAAMYAETAAGTSVTAAAGPAMLDGMRRDSEKLAAEEWSATR